MSKAENSAAAAAAPQQDDSDDELKNQTESQYYNCRFYRKRMPEVGEITKVETTHLMDLGANV